MIIPTLEGLTLSKGHAGGSDAVIVPDFGGRREISRDDAAQICDRRAGIGADALMRVVQAGDDWRIDAWDSHGDDLTDLGSLVRLAAHYLHVSGLVHLDDGATMTFAVGSKHEHVTRIGGGYARGF